jgi:hypothetical protein
MMKDPEDYDPEVDGEPGFLVDTEPIEDDERWDDFEASDEFLK